MTRRVQRLTLELELGGDADSIAGRLTDLSGRTTEFAGWLGLASAIETLTETEQTRTTTWDSH